MIRTLLNDINRWSDATLVVGRYFALFLFFLAGTLQVNAQLSYSVEQLPGVTFAFPLGSRTVLNAGYPINSGAPVDDAVYSVPIPFTFNFNGSGYTSLNMSSNGYITFGSAPSATNITPISSGESYTGAVSIYGADLMAANNVLNNNMGYVVSGSPGSQVLKLEWITRRKLPGNNMEATTLIMQIWLYEGTNVIEMYFNGLYNPATTTVVFGQLGLRGANNSQFKNLSHMVTQDWPAGVGMPLGTLNTDGVRTRNGNSRILATSNRLFRWTPETCFAPSTLTASAVTGTSATLTWPAATPAPAGGYHYYYTTSAVVPNAATTPTGTTGPGVLTTPLTGLSGSTTYYAYVRSDCGSGDLSPWRAVTFTTLCSSQNIPYLQYFNPLEPGYNYTIPAIPPCSSIQNLGTGNDWVTQNFSAPDGFFDEHLVYNAHGSNAANVWFFTQGVTLVAGQTYRMSYLYGGSTEFAFLTNKMKVMYGNLPNAASMTTPIADHPSIKASPTENIVNFTPPTSGIYYFGFHAYSAPNMGSLFVDDIQIVEAVCIKPINVAANNITGTGALITWDEPVPAPANGYAYYLTLTNSPPSYTQIPSGYTSTGTNVLNLTGLGTNTTYYIWVRGNCGTGDFSEWSDGINFTTLNPPVYTYCTPAPTSVDGQGIVNVTVGSINNSSGAEPGNYGNYSSMITNVAQGATVNVAITFNTSIFNYNTKIWIDWNNDSDFYDAGENVYTGLSASTSPNTLNASFVVPIGAILGEHRMRIGGADIDLLTGTGAGQGPCYTGTWASFEDYTVNVVVPPPALSINITSDTQCAGTNSSLVLITSPLSNYSTYSWSPSIGVTGDEVSGYIFNPITTITYTLTGIQTGFPFSTNTVSFTYYANQLPTPIVIAPAVPETCLNGPAVQLTATGGIVSGITLLSEDFNGSPVTGWTTTNASTGGAVAAAAWTLRSSGYNPGGATGISSIISNDATQFYLSNSDAQGSGTNTNVTLTSPVFSLAGYTDASLSFYHYYKPWINGMARVEIYSGGSWNPAPILSWGNTGTGTVAQGTPTNFAQVVYNLGAYAGQAGLQIRFNYTASWGYVWAIDNFRISGSATSEITWTPTTGLYTDAAATIAYTGTGTSTVYALPTVTTTYTASASTPLPTVCSTNTDTTVTITAVAAGTVAPVNQSVCSAADPLVLTGASGTVTQWQYATDVAFTIGVTNIPASASTTLSSAQIGSFTGIRYYRAVVSSAGCSGYSNIVSIDYSATTVWTGTWSNGVPTGTKKVIFNANYSSSANVDACSVEILSGNIVFNSGHILHVENEVIRTGGTLTFENDASLVQVNDASVNSGYIVYKRNTTPMVLDDYTYWSSPLTPQTLVGLSPNTSPDKYYSFDTTLNTYVLASPASLMTKGKGFIVRAPEGYTSTPQIFQGIFNGGANNGVPNNGVVNIPIVYAGVNDMNLIGNPYPSALDVDLFMSHPSNTPVVGGTIYLWTHNTPVTAGQYTGSDYAIYNFMGGVGTSPATNPGVNNSIPTKNIAAGQGFFIKGLATATAIMNNAMRVLGNNSEFFRAAETNAQSDSEKHRIWLAMTNNTGAYKQILVGYTNEATNGMDRKFDGLTAEAGNLISLYSMVGTNTLGIQGRAMPFSVTDQVPLGYRADFGGNYEIHLSDFDGLFTNVNVGIYLEDKLLNIIHDLRLSDYSFATAPGTYNERFVLRYTDSSLTNPEFDASNSIVVYKNENGLHIHSGTVIMDKVLIYDLRGRLLAGKHNIRSAETLFDNLSPAQQVLLIKVTTIDGIITVKKVIF